MKPEQAHAAPQPITSTASKEVQTILFQIPLISCGAQSHQVLEPRKLAATRIVPGDGCQEWNTDLRSWPRWKRNLQKRNKAGGITVYKTCYIPCLTGLADRNLNRMMIIVCSFA